MELYSYFRSSAAFRVRIALALKGLSYDYKAVHLPRGEQLKAEFEAVSPTRLVPQLVDGEVKLGQSLAIIEYLDEMHPEPPLLPRAPAERARVRGLALDIACEIHPLDNLRVLRYLVRELKVGEDAKNTWYRHWVEQGLAAVEKQLAASRQTGACCHGDTPTLADCVLVPQIFNAQRFDCRLDHVPTVMRVFEHCMRQPAFQAAQPFGVPGFRAVNGAALPEALPQAIRPAFGASQVRALMTTRQGGVSRGGHASLNLRQGLGDDEAAVEENLARLRAAIGAQPAWLKQVHGARVLRLPLAEGASNEADACITTEPGVVCAVQVADCLPVLFATCDGRAVGAAHAGWRGLAAGVLEATVDALGEAAACEPADIEAWLGPCIGPRQFEVGADVLAGFGIDAGADHSRFKPQRPGKWLADLAGLARDRLEAHGLRQIEGGAWCTVEDGSRFFSFRRDTREHGACGRMAACIWILPGLGSEC